MITTGDTRMSVMPQLAFPAPVQLPEPLAGLNAGLDTAGKYAQLAENEQMNPIRQQLAQLQVRQAQKQLDQPVWDLKSQTTELQPRDVPPVDQGATIDDAAYQALIKGGLSKEEAEGALTWQGPNASGEDVTGAHEILANEGFDEDTINKLLNPPQPPAAPEIPQDLYSVSTYEDRNNPGRTRTERALHQTAEQMRDIAAQAIQRGHEKEQWVTKDVTDPSDPNRVITLSTNLTTGESKVIGGAAKTASQIDLNQAKTEASKQATQYAAQTQQAKAVWANVLGHVPSQKELDQMNLDARLHGCSVPMIAMIRKSQYGPYIMSYLGAINGLRPELRDNPTGAWPQDPAAQKAIMAEYIRISKEAPVVEETLDAANGIKVPGMAPGAPAAVSIPSNPAIAGQAGVTVMPRVDMPAPATTPATRPWWKEALDAINPMVAPHAPARVAVRAPANVAPVAPIVTTPPTAMTVYRKAGAIPESNIPTVTTQADLDALNSGDPFYSPLYPGQLLHKR
jgi:hypothetical protein